MPKKEENSWIVAALNFLLLWVLIALLLLSAIFLLLTCYEFASSENYKFSFTSEGLNTCLIAIGRNKSLLLGTLTVSAAYLALNSLKVSSKIQFDRLKQDRFSEWKTVLELRNLSVDKADEILLREFTKSRYKFFTVLYRMDFEINNRDELYSIFNELFGHKISLFEYANKQCAIHRGIYPDESHSYAYDSFRFLFIGCLDSFYDELEKDLRLIYFQKMNSNRIIDPILHRKAFAESMIKVI